MAERDTELRKSGAEGENMDLWSYIIEVDSQDCDGRHHSRVDFMGVETPNEVVYDRANLFALGGPSSVRVIDESTRDSGIAYVSEPNDEGGGRTYTITWDRVKSACKRDEFLAEYERQGPRLSYGHRYTDLYRLRLKETVHSIWETATYVGVTVDPGGRCFLASIARWTHGVMDPLWTRATSDEPAFEEDALRTVEHDLTALHHACAVNHGQFLRL